MEVLQFRKVTKEPEIDSTIHVFLAGTQNLATGLRDMQGNPLVNPFEVGQAGSAEDWGFQPENNELSHRFDIWWEEEDIVLAANYQFSPATSTKLSSKKIYHGIAKAGVPTYNEATDTFTLPTDNGELEYWYAGMDFSSVVGLDLVLTPQDNTQYYITFNAADGQLHYSDQEWVVAENVLVATVFLNDEVPRKAAIVDERHGHTRDRAWHKNAHLTIGARINPIDFAMTAPSVASPSTIDIAGGTIYDEDLATLHGQLTNCRIWYQVAADKYTFRNSDSFFLGTVQRVEPADYSLVDIAPLQHINMWAYVASDTQRGIYVVLETKADAGYLTAVQARQAVRPNLATFKMTNEIKVLYGTIFKGDGSFVEAEDLRAEASLPYGGSLAATAASVTLAPVAGLPATDVQQGIQELKEDIDFGATLQMQELDFGDIDASDEDIMSFGLADSESNSELAAIFGVLGITNIAQLNPLSFTKIQDIRSYYHMLKSLDSELLSIDTYKETAGVAATLVDEHDQDSYRPHYSYLAEINGAYNQRFTVQAPINYSEAVQYSMLVRRGYLEGHKPPIVHDSTEVYTAVSSLSQYRGFYARGGIGIGLFINSDTATVATGLDTDSPVFDAATFPLGATNLSFSSVVYVHKLGRIFFTVDNDNWLRSTDGVTITNEVQLNSIRGNLIYNPGKPGGSDTYPDALLSVNYGHAVFITEHVTDWDNYPVLQHTVKDWTALLVAEGLDTSSGYVLACQTNGQANNTNPIFSLFFSRAAKIYSWTNTLVPVDDNYNSWQTVALSTFLVNLPMFTSNGDLLLRGSDYIYRFSYSWGAPGPEAYLPLSPTQSNSYVKEFVVDDNNNISYVAYSNPKPPGSLSYTELVAFMDHPNGVMFSHFKYGYDRTADDYMVQEHIQGDDGYIYGVSSLSVYRITNPFFNFDISNLPEPKSGTKSNAPVTTEDWKTIELTALKDGVNGSCIGAVLPEAATGLKIKWRFFTDQISSANIKAVIRLNEAVLLSVGEIALGALPGDPGTMYFQGHKRPLDGTVDQWLASSDDSLYPFADAQWFDLELIFSTDGSAIWMYGRGTVSYDTNNLMPEPVSIFGQNEDPHSTPISVDAIHQFAGYIAEDLLVPGGSRTSAEMEAWYTTL